MDENSPPDERYHRRKKRQSGKLILLGIVLLVLGLAAAGIFFFQAPKKNQEPAPGISPATSVDQVTLPEQQEESAPAEPAEDAQEILPSGEEAVGPIPVMETPEEKRARECTAIADRLNVFFTHVDGKEYLKPFQLGEPSLTYFIALADKLLNNPPVVSRESDDLYTILKNMAHFFRIIGKENILLIKAIMDRERDKIEDVAADLYQWTTWQTCSDDRLTFSPKLKEMYEYAGFFLNTMGGRSYLFRRDSRSRLLVNYYSIMLVERANREGLNRHGIDVTEMVSLLIQEMESSSQLIYKETYIDNLDTLLEKYQ